MKPRHGYFLSFVYFASVVAAGCAVASILTVHQSFAQNKGLTEHAITPEYIRHNIRSDRPRLVLTQSIEQQLKNKLQTDPVVENMYKAVQLNAEAIMAEPLLERKVVGRRLLGTSREMLYRMNILGLVYRMEKEPAVLQRINRELLAVLNFKDWNPSHFLDVAEMALAVSLAIDWAGKDLPPSTVEQAKNALIQKAIKPSFDKDGNTGWVTGTNNWNQVCHAGMIAAATVTAEKNTGLAAKTIHRALEGMPHALEQYRPDGVYPEGPTYWTYGTTFSALAFSMLESAFGTAFGLPEYPGFTNSANFKLLTVSPTERYYNFSDSGDRRSENGDLTLAWFAARTGNQIYFEKNRFLRDPKKIGKLPRYAGAGLVWLSQFEAAKKNSLPLVWKGEGTNPIVIFRSKEDDPRQYYFAAKGGRASNSHGNMDAGSFVFELDGVRWVTDPGNQGYHELEKTGFDLWGGCQECERWTLLTKNNYGHSTLTVNNELHLVNGFAPIVDFKNGDQPEATVDLSKVFGGNLEGLTRRFVKENDRSLMIEDAFVINDSTTNVTWQLMTTAEVSPRDGGAVLKKDGQRLALEILSPANVDISVVSLNPPPMKLDKRVENLKRLEIRVPAWLFNGQEGRIAVRLTGSE